MSKKNNIILTLIISIIVVFAIGTYAWFTWNSKENTELTLTIGELADVTFSTGDDINVENIGPVLNYLNDGEITTFSLRNKSELELFTNIDLNITSLPEELKDESFKYVLLSSSDNIHFEEKVSGNFKDKNVGTLSLVSKEPSKVGTTYYKFIIYIDGNVDNPIDMMGKSFSAKIEVKVAEDLTGAEYIESLLPSNPETMNNDDPDGNVRYMGADPNNYVSFNNELWRIIGVFDVASTYNGPTEKRLKIIREESIGEYSWDNKPSGTGSSTSSWGSNDWTDSALMQVLNSGPYWNRTNGTCPSGQNGTTTGCDFSSIGLTQESKNLIGDAVWNLGGTGNLFSSDTGLPIQLYDIERGNGVYNGRPIYWIGKVGLMYPSDFGYATSGGPTTSRSDCLNTSMGMNPGGGGGSANRSLSYLLSTGGFWMDSGYSDCSNNDYLHESSMDQWTIMPDSSYSSSVFYVSGSANLISVDANNGRAVRPTVYLNSSVLIASGDGSQNNPYVLSA